MSISDREIVNTRLLDASRERVFAASGATQP